MTKDEQKRVIQAHYGLEREVTNMELLSEVNNLIRKDKKGNLDDNQSRLFYRLQLDQAKGDK